MADAPSPSLDRRSARGSRDWFGELAERAVDSGAFAGLVAIAGTTRDILYEGAFGRRSLASDERMTMDTVFMLASMTKTVTAVAALQLVERGLIQLDQPAGEIVPELADLKVLEGFDRDGRPRLRPAERPVTLRALLSHTSGFAHDVWSGDLVRFQQATGTPDLGTQTNASLRLPLFSEPGSRWEYSIGLEWVGKMIEAVSGQTLGAYIRDHVTGPLGMRDTAFGIVPAHAGRLATVHQRDADGSLRPIDMKALPGEYEAGGGGLYGTAPDYLTFLRMLLDGGRHGEIVQILRPETVHMACENHIGGLAVTCMRSVMPDVSNDFELFPGVTKQWSLLAMVTPEPGENGRSAGSVTWGGIANCYFWLDFTKGIAGIFLTQIMPFGDPQALDLYGAFERQIYGRAP